MNVATKALLLLALTSGLVSMPSHSEGQNEHRMTFHVTSVKTGDSPDFCQTGQCSATRFTVEGYLNIKSRNALIEFVLNCDEITVFEPRVKKTLVCPRVHANFDYQVMVLDDAIFFGEEKDTNLYDDSPKTTAYAIVSEKEVAQKPCK